ncbi:hypothetical protein P167DRAFT_575016 [Morchella conica CCBAS932]|uniref:GYF domain-containing protein n=1 Tax=Morchella conica CCBAS932 TaxID=1392247 RepID=A0A3N4KMM3_9PEZI|nr:hypothetical protein P167DRAFT_575016 [Morchella conica CCBAS932]
MLTSSDPSRTRRANGNSATSSTHRRPSLSTTLTHPPTSQHSQPPLTPSGSNVYHPPHHYNRGGVGGSINTTYSKDDLLGIFRQQEQSGNSLRDVKDLVLGDTSSGNSAGWGRTGDEGGADVCWDKDGGLKPVSLEELTEEERELFSNNVNSPHKVPPNQSNQGPTNHHTVVTNTPPPKRSNSGALPGNITTPGANRPQNRRRETSDAALTGSPFTSTPPQVPRRRTELREAEDTGGRGTLFGRWGSGTSGEDDHAKDKGTEEGSTAGGARSAGLIRKGSGAWPSGVAGSSGFASSGALNSPMGSFGNGTFGGTMGGFSLQSTTNTADKAKAGGGASGARGSTAPPKVEDVEEEDDDVNRVVSHAVDHHRDEEERERPMSSDTDPFGDRDQDDHGTGQGRHSPRSSMDDPHRIKNSASFGNMASAAVNASRGGNSIATPTKIRSDLGFSGLGGSREGLTLGGMGQGSLHQQLQNLQLNQHGNYPLHGRSRQGSIGGMVGGLNENEPLSPTETNPYQSPAPEKADDDDINDIHGDGGHGSGIIGGGFKRDVGAPGSDRSGRSSTAGLGAVGGLSGFGSISGSGLWGGQVGTPGLGTSAAPSAFFGSGLGDLASPGGTLLSSSGMGGMGSIGGGGGPFGSASRSRLAQMFSPEQQQQMEDENGGFESNDGFGDLRFGGFGSRRGFGNIDSPMRDRGDVSDLFSGLHTTRSLGNIGAQASGDSMFSREREDSFTLGSLQMQNQSNSMQPPMSHQAQPIRPPPGTVPPQPQTVLVMPDKIQWTYRDPSGTIQGPFSGLEMHDWYKAGFFTQELAVKRIEDHDFEPLGQLVRRIGNTREPFLVPLQAPPGSTAPTAAPAAPVPNAWSGWPLDAQQPGTVQPPFAGSFPSFGTTLTADQQNALERRKQEEQYLLARQREFLVQQQIFAKNQVLHHQHSQQSLHSQPSYGSLQGSLQSPGGFATPTAGAPSVGPQNAFEPGVLLRQAGAAAGGGGDTFGVGHGLQGMPGQQMQPGNQFLQQQQQQIHPPNHIQLEQQKQLLDMQRQTQRIYQNQHQQVEKQQELEHAQQQQINAAAQTPQQAQQDVEKEEDKISQEQHEQAHESNERSADAASSSPDDHWDPESEHKPSPQANEQLKTSVPKGSSAKASPIPKQAQPAPPASVWQEIEQPLVQPFPPPPGSHHASEIPSSTLPMTRSPSSETPHTSVSVAPWANKENEVKGPSLKEIQEVEARAQQAKDAAEAEHKRQMMLQQVNTQPPPPAPGLPSTATWATSPSGTPSSSQASAWAKPLVKANTLPTGGAKKTLQQIQKEEELRKAKAVAAAAAAAQATQNVAAHPTPAGGKRYADLAGKTQQLPQLNTVGVVGGVWTTVGPGGKSKNLATSPIPTAPAQSLKTAPSTPALGLPVPTTAKKVSPTSPASKPPTMSANEEFMKWCKASIKGLNQGLQADELIQTLLTFPAETELIAETIYTCTTTMDGRRFAEEFVRRRSAANKGIIIDAGTANGGASGWNEVAKGKPQPVTREVSPETNAAFKVVPGKKKGRR